MGFIGKLFGHQDEGQGSVQILERPADEVCLHTAAAPEWDSLDDMGKDERVARFRCPACGEVFEAAEYRRLQERGSERLAHVMEPGTGDDA